MPKGTKKVLTEYVTDDILCIEYMCAGYKYN